MSCGLGMVGWDLVRVLRYSSGVPARDWLSLLAAIVAMVAAHTIVVGAVVAPFYAFALGERSIRTVLAGVARWLGAGLSKRAPEDAVRTHAALLATPLAAAVFAAVVIPLTMTIHHDVRVARNAALASLLVHLGGAVVGAGFFVAARGALLAGLQRLVRLAPLDRLLCRPWTTALGLGIAVLAALVAVLVVARQVLAALDLTWLWAILAAGCVGLILALLRTLTKLSSTARRIIGFGWLGLLCVFCVVATLALSYSNNTRSLLVDHTSYAKLLNQTQVLLFDWDRDGYTTFFGGNDCAPRNPAIHPGALDIPYNGIDEDCSGADLRYDKTDQPGRWDHELPASFPKRPSIVLLTVDALNPDHLGINQYKRPTSKHIDAFAKDSVRFAQAYSQGPSTRLSFPSLFTSKYDPQIDRARRGRIPLEVRGSNLTVAEVFQKSGYTTIAVLPDPYFNVWKGITQGFGRVDRSPTRGKGKHTAKAVSDAVIAQLEKAKQEDKPFLLWAHYYDPHGPFDQPPDSPVFGTSNEDRYDAEIHHADAHIGRVLTWLDDNLPRSQRVTILSADHGESFDSLHPTKHHGYDLHSSVLHVPLFIQVPGGAPRTLKGPVTLLDVTPTLVNLAKLQGAKSFEGTSLVPALFGGELRQDRVTFHTFFLPENFNRNKEPLRMASARTGRHNLIYNRTQEVYSLFDFTEDPVETKNLYSALPAVANELRDRIQLWTYEVGDKSKGSKNKH